MPSLILGRCRRKKFNKQVFSAEPSQRRLIMTSSATTNGYVATNVVSRTNSDAETNCHSSWAFFEHELERLPKATFDMETKSNASSAILATALSLTPSILHIRILQEDVRKRPREQTAGVTTMDGMANTPTHRASTLVQHRRRVPWPVHSTTRKPTEVRTQVAQRPCRLHTLAHSKQVWWHGCIVELCPPRHRRWLPKLLTLAQDSFGVGAR